MKFSVPRTDFIKPLSAACAAIESRHTLPILTHVLFQHEEGKLKLTGSDLEVDMVAMVPNVKFTDTTNGLKGITVPAKKLYDIVRSLPDDSVLNFDADENNVTVKSGKSKFKLSSLSGNDYPSVEDFEPAITIRAETSILRSMLGATMISMADQDVRYYLNGMYMEFSAGHLIMVSTDGHRLSMSEASVPDYHSSVEGKDSFTVIIPRKSVMEIAKLLNDKSVKPDDVISIDVANNRIRLNVGDVLANIKTIDGKFPDYRRVIPKEGPNTMTAKMNVNELRSVLARSVILSNERYKGGRFLFEGNTLKISASNPESEGSEETIDCEYDGASVEIGFNLNYLRDACSVLNAEFVTFGLTDGNSSALVKPVGNISSTYVIMPMRL